MHTNLVQCMLWLISRVNFSLSQKKEDTKKHQLKILFLVTIGYQLNMSCSSINDIVMCPQTINVEAKRG